MADKTTGELQQELMEQPNIKAYLSKTGPASWRRAF